MKIRIVEPAPYFEISMDCSNRRFFDTKNRIYNIADRLDPDQKVDYQNGHMTESCDYEGDLDKILIYNSDEVESFVDAIKKEFDIKETIPRNMNIVFTT